MGDSVKQFYDEGALEEWRRLERHPFEFRLTVHMMDKYVHPGDRVLDIGGGPGRYAIYHARRGCEVALVDLSEGNVALAREKAEEAGVRLEAHACDCLALDKLELGAFDHVFLMGPLYHLQSEQDRKTAVEKALAHLKPGGVFYASFILLASGLIYDLKNGGNIVSDMNSPVTRGLLDDIVSRRPYTGGAFTTARFDPPGAIRPFMERFGLETLHLFGQEGILAPNEPQILERDAEEIECWVEVAKRLLEVPELLAYSEHAMYIGRKKQ